MAARVFPDLLRPARRLAAAVVAGFFVVTLILPIDTMGDPAFDIPILRARWFEGWGVIWVHLALILALIWQMARRPGWAVAAALATSAVAFVLMIAEEGQLIQYGSLILPHEAALFRLSTNRFATAAFSVIALVAVWRIDARP